MVPSRKDNEDTMLERRKEQRWPAFLDGKMGFSQRRFRLSCLVQNISDLGAKLVLRNAADLPAKFDVSIPRMQTVYVVQTRWRLGNSVGVEIKQRHPVVS